MLLRPPRLRRCEAAEYRDKGDSGLRESSQEGRRRRPTCSPSRSTRRPGLANRTTEDERARCCSPSGAVASAGASAHPDRSGRPIEPDRHSMAPAGRNEPWPRGSGRKFRHCCLRAQDEEDGHRVRLPVSRVWDYIRSPLRVRIRAGLPRRRVASGWRTEPVALHFLKCGPNVPRLREKTGQTVPRLRPAPAVRRRNLSHGDH